MNKVVLPAGAGEGRLSPIVFQGGTCVFLSACAVTCVAFAPAWLLREVPLSRVNP